MLKITAIICSAILTIATVAACLAIGGDDGLD